jgi:hypothetical protein
MLFLVSPPGHEHYLDELGAVIGQGRPDPAVIAEVRARHDIEQLTPWRSASAPERSCSELPDGRVGLRPGTWNVAHDTEGAGQFVVPVGQAGAAGI